MDTFGRSVSQASVLRFRPTLPDFFADVESSQSSISESGVHLDHAGSSAASSVSTTPTGFTFDVIGTPLQADGRDPTNAGAEAEDDEGDEAGVIPPKRLFPVSRSSGLLHKASFSALSWNTRMIGSGSMVGIGASSGSVHGLSRLTRSRSESQRDEASPPRRYDGESLDSDFDISLGDIADDELPGVTSQQGAGAGALRYRRRAASIGSTLTRVDDAAESPGGTLTPGDRGRERPDDTDSSSPNVLFTRSPPSVYSSESGIESGPESEGSAQTKRAGSSRKDSGTRTGGAQTVERENDDQGPSAMSSSWRPRMSILRSLSASAVEGSHHLPSPVRPSIYMAQRQQPPVRKSVDISGKRRSLPPRTPYPFPRQQLPHPSVTSLRTDSPESDLTETPERFRRPGNPIPNLSPPLTISMTPSTTLISSVTLDTNAFDQLRGTLGDLLSCWCETFTTNGQGSRRLAARRRAGSGPGTADERGKGDGGWAEWRNQLITCAMIIFVAQLLMLLTVASKGRDAVVDGFRRVLVYRSDRAAKLRQGPHSSENRKLRK